MRTHLEFQSAQFCEPDDCGNTYNPEIKGAALARFLSQQFQAEGFDGTIIEEDWGWMIELANDPFHLSMGCASYDDPGSWQIIISPDKPYVRRWLRKIDCQPQVAAIAEKLEKILVTHGGATNLIWWSDQDSGRK